MNKQSRNENTSKTSYGPGPAAYDSLLSLKRGIMRNKPKFAYFTEEGANSALIRKTIALTNERA